MRHNQVKLFLICCSLALSCNFQYGFSSTYFNTPVASFKIYLNESITSQGFIFTEETYEWMWNLLLNIWFIGFFFGLWISPLLNDRYGRKIGFICGTSFSLFASVLRFLGIICRIPQLLFVGRIIVSITAAVMYQSLILYIQECSPTHLRGMMSFTSEMSYASMCVLGLALGTDEIFGLKLHYLLGFPIIPCKMLFFSILHSIELRPAGLLAVIVLLPIPETPKFLLITKNNRKAAIKSVQFFHGESVDLQNVLSEIEKEGEEEGSSSLKEIFSTPYLRKATIISCLALQNTVSLWAILLSSTYFLRTVHVQDNISAWSSTAMGIAYAAGTVLGFIIVERLPRRCLLLTFSTLDTLCLVVFVACAAMISIWEWTKYGCLISFLAFGFIYGLKAIGIATGCGLICKNDSSDELPLIIQDFSCFKLIHLCCFRAGVGPVSWILCTELVPQRHRSLIQSLCYSINTIMVVISTFAVLPLYSVVGAYAFLILYIVPSAGCIIYLYKNLPETMGREIYEIVADLKGAKGETRSNDSTSSESLRY
uniref:Major facilitator superfamily (MFS) profile domain-containing protein n=1 Tax=Ascaris lumbricoides TaxID=6252 RepID=A0A9J2P5R8_ASCLU